MTAQATNHSFRDVGLHPIDWLQPLDPGVRVPATYRKIWHDGFGARGWKLNATIGDPAIIASTRQTGDRINTSVLVHDILDHFISGFGVSGHRSEAMALMQLSKRTGSDPRVDFRQIVVEDVMKGRVNGESLHAFLPDRMRSMLPQGEVLTDKQTIACLEDALGHDALVELLVDHMVTLGRSGENHAIASWKKLGLDRADASAVGMVLQQLLLKVDDEAESTGVDELGAAIVITDTECAFIIDATTAPLSAMTFHAAYAD